MSYCKLVTLIFKDWLFSMMWYMQLFKSAREVSKFASMALVDIDSEDVQVYVKYFDITLIPSTVFFFNAQHMKMDSGWVNALANATLYSNLLLWCAWFSCLFVSMNRSADHTKWVGSFHRKQDVIDVVEVTFCSCHATEYITLLTYKIMFSSVSRLAR